MEFVDVVLDLAADLEGLLEGRIGDEAILDRYFSGAIDRRLQMVKDNAGQYLDDFDRR